MFISTKWVYGLVLGSALLLGGAGEAGAQAAGAAGGGAPAVTPLSYRKQIMQHLQQNMGALGAVRSGAAGAPSHALPRATIIHQLAMMMNESFPAGSGGEDSRALPAVWENAAGYAQAVQDFQTATAALVEAARGSDMEQVAAAQQGVQRACAACHTQFRAPAPAR